MPEGPRTEFDRSRAETIRRRARIYVLVIAVLWIPLMVLVDPLNFGSSRGGLWKWLPTLTGMVGMMFYLRGRRSRRATEIARERTAAIDRQREDFLMELHDGVCGRLARAVLVLDRMAAIHAGDKALEGAVLAVREGLAEARGLLTVLGTGPESWDDVVAQLRWESASACEKAGVELEFTTEGESPASLSLAAAATHALRRIASEGITNAIRHGEATRVRMLLRACAEEVRVRVEDNGRGNGSTTHLGHGLSTVRRRAGRLDGGATFSNGPQGGFVLEAWLRPDSTGAADRVRN